MSNFGPFHFVTITHYTVYTAFIVHHLQHMNSHAAYRTCVRGGVLIEQSLTLHTPYTHHSVNTDRSKLAPLHVGEAQPVDGGLGGEGR
jgi:hypothetical protein